MDAIHVASASDNIITSVALAIAGLFALGMAWLPARHKRPLPPLLALGAGVALVALAADEGLELHDRVGRWLWNEHAIEAPGPINHVDDVIVIGYLAAGALSLLIALPFLFRSPRFLLRLMLAGVLLTAGTSFDAFGIPGNWTEVPEESLEALGALVLAFAFWREASRDAHLVKLPHARLHGISLDPRAT
jgi:multisubunit Na+/H+ antiporter MnhB subunit